MIYIIGILISFLLGMLCNILALIPVTLAGAGIGFKILYGEYSISIWYLIAVVLSITQIILTELGCKYLKHLNKTIGDDYLSPVAFRSVTFVFVLLLSGGCYVSYYFLEDIICQMINK